jgi:hypothetical protein
MEETTQAESSKISTSLEVEQIDANLFRSVNLFVPVRARGVFGGQVISQAIVSATRCVDPAFGLHVSSFIFAIFAKSHARVVVSCEGGVFHLSRKCADRSSAISCLVHPLLSPSSISLNDCVKGDRTALEA